MGPSRLPSTFEPHWFATAGYAPRDHGAGFNGQRQAKAVPRGLDLGPDNGLHLEVTCTHLDQFAKVVPSADGCEECLKIGQTWVHLRLCRVCGHVGCCDESIGKHATHHFHTSRHPVMETYYPAEGWGWCYVDEEFIDLDGDVTPHPSGWGW